ncbi:hypothetical protein DPMN_000820 [Dreissena polymorpha]|uniref:Uncharacterized protein n=1 Tax=Dreissena polymorpha TaxID=45954 RepID=A0A9D4MG44_DREPO|nr:hypothetical protein DPMN_000820 [Dreissena polymorpha]
MEVCLTTEHTTAPCEACAKRTPEIDVNGVTGVCDTTVQDIAAKLRKIGDEINVRYCGQSTPFEITKIVKLTVGIAPLDSLAELCPAPARGPSGPLITSKSFKILDPPLNTVVLVVITKHEFVL